jgi:uncharacterized Zn finger protein (UPF0148 family)
MICANKECSKDFEPRTHNQKYCTDECCRVATNKRIMEKYYEKKAIKGGLHRVCKKCSVKLSRYNENVLCSICEKNVIVSNKASMMRMINEVS